jgi:hypothetical protein
MKTSSIARWGCRSTGIWNIQAAEKICLITDNLLTEKTKIQTNILEIKKVKETAWRLSEIMVSQLRSDQSHCVVAPYSWQAWRTTIPIRMMLNLCTAFHTNYVRSFPEGSEWRFVISKLILIFGTTLAAACWPKFSPDQTLPKEALYFLIPSRTYIADTSASLYPSDCGCCTSPYHWVGLRNCSKFSCRVADCNF